MTRQPVTRAGDVPCSAFLGGNIRCRLAENHAGNHDFRHQWKAEFEGTSACKLCGQSITADEHSQILLARAPMLEDSPIKA